ncbi:MAG TPA: signal peptidase I [Nitrososphaerales archaeon]|nr:signal peptidase I [Nitrososphaerales archaeon]
MSLAKSISRAITYVLIVIVIVAGAQLVVGSAQGSSPVYVVVSKSMVPTLQIGDLVITEKVPFSSIHVGQVIVYQQPTPSGMCPNPDGLTIVHRVVEITSAGLITQGDDRITNPYPDEPSQWPPLPASCVKGVVVVALPYLGLVSMLIPYPWNYALVGLILIFVFVSEVRPAENPRGKAGRTRAASSERGREPQGSSPSPGISLPS